MYHWIFTYTFAYQTNNKSPMKFYHILFIIATCCLFSSCFKEEPLNAECDIIKASIPDQQLKGMFFNPTDRDIDVLSSDNTICFNVRQKANLTAIAPQFQLTEGATINPVNGSTHNFSKGAVIYTVTSQNGEWKRKYSVNFIPTLQTIKDTIPYDFEQYKLEPNDKKCYIWYEKSEDGNETNNWATGNIAFSFGAGDLPANQYPTAPVSKGGYHGSYVKLTTCSTGELGRMFGKPMAAGNIFIGSFDAANSLINPLEATHFGIKFDKKPTKLTGWYKYKPGKDFQDQSCKILKGKSDCAAIYAVFYRNTIIGKDGKRNSFFLDGTNVLTSPNIVAIAQVKDIKPTSQWTFFEIEFTYTKEIDNKLLANRGYNLAIIFSSSKDGAKFEGAIGSELCIDDVKLICTHQE